jgi:APA family basic amino acid/polyamine antiporter
VNSPALLIVAWAVAGFMTVVAAVSYGELAAMMPKAGGQYVYLRESLGPLWGFLYGWTFFLVIQCGTIAAVGVAFGKFMGVFFPGIASTNWILHLYKVPPIPIGPMMLGNMDVGLNTQNLVAILTIVLLSIVNVYGIRLGAIIQDIFTFAKIAALAFVILIGISIGRNHEAIAANFGNFWQNTGSDAFFPTIGLGGLIGMVVIVGVAQVGSLFSADAWNSVTFTAAEVKNPQRNLPISLAVGTGAVIGFYILANFVYLMVLPLAGIQNAPEDRVGTAVMQQIFGGAGAGVMALLVLVSTFGCNNGLILSGARVYYAMAKDGLFFKPVARLHPKYKTPAVSLIVQMIWTSVLCLSGSYGQLLDYTIFAVLIFYILTLVGLFVLRRTQPDAPRPYKAFGYPVLPAIYILMAVIIDIVLLIYKPQYTWPGLIIVLLGIPVYYVWSRRNAATSAA